MNRLRLWLSVVVCMLIVGALKAQRSCGTMDHLHYEEEIDPERKIQLEEIERHAQQVMMGGARAVEGVITIPVVFHIVYNTAAQNISEAQIQSQIDILNEDFRRLNADAINTPEDFAGGILLFNIRKNVIRVPRLKILALSLCRK